MEDQLELKHADSNNSIPPPPPPVAPMAPMPPVATVESLSLHSPDGEESVKIGGDNPPPPGAEDVPPGMESSVPPAREDPPPQDYDGGDEEKTTAAVVVEEKEVRNDNCCERILRCLSYVPCGSLISWIILLLGLGAMAGSVLVGTRKTRTLLQDDELLWFMELTVTGVVVSMVVLGTCFLIAGHVSTDPTSRRLFNSTSKNRCARGFNIFLLVFVYVLCVVWILGSLLLATPIVLLVLMYLVTGDLQPGECFQLQHYGFPAREICSPELTRFKEDAQDVLICYGVTLLAAVLVVISMVHFLICISANITHLKDNRFATLNAYETEELRNSKHSVLDTNM